MPEDAELLQLYIQGSDAAFAEIVRRYIDVVYSVALRQVGGDSHLAADVTQVVFAALARKSRRLATHKVLGGWLYRAARFAAADQVRAESRRREREKRAQMMQVSDNSGPADAESAVDWDALRPVLDHVISELSDVTRDAVVLRFFEGRSFAELGARLAVTENAARKRVTHALDRMQRALRRRGIHSTEAALAAVLAQQVATAAPSGLATSLAMPLGGAPAAGLFVSTLMKITQTWKIGLGVAVLIAGTATVSIQHSTVERLELENAGLRDQLKASSRLAAENRRLQATTAAAAARALPQQQMPASQPRGPANADSGGSARVKALEDGQAFLTAYGQKAHDMLISIGKAQVARRYAALVASGMITPAQMDELERQTADQWSDSIAVTPPNGIVPTNPNLSDDQVKAILGDQGFEQFHNYQRMQPLQGLVNDVSSLSLSAPLTPEQSSQLLAVLANASTNYASGGNASPQSVDWDQALAQAQGILSDPQIKALKAEAQLPQIMALVRQFYQNPPAAK